jgi:hypothetical protein
VAHGLSPQYAGACFRTGAFLCSHLNFSGIASLMGYYFQQKNNTGSKGARCIIWVKVNNAARSGSGLHHLGKKKQ